MLFEQFPSILKQLSRIPSDSKRFPSDEPIYFPTRIPRAFLACRNRKLSPRSRRQPTLKARCREPSSCPARPSRTHPIIAPQPSHPPPNLHRRPPPKHRAPRRRHPSPPALRSAPTRRCPTFRMFQPPAHPSPSATCPPCLAGPAHRQPEPATHASCHACAPIAHLDLPRPAFAGPPKHSLSGLPAQAGLLS